MSTEPMQVVDAANSPAGLVLRAIPLGRNGAADIEASTADRVIHRDCIIPTKDADRQKFARRLMEKLGDHSAVSFGDVEQELLTLCKSLDDRRHLPNDQSQASGGANVEIPATQVVRPELIIQENVSAIAIPRIVRVAGQPVGDWLHYVQCGSDRYASSLGDRMVGGRAEDIWLSPLPERPTPGDVNDLNRWSLSSRASWLDGAAAPTTAQVLRMVAERLDRYIVLPLDHRLGHGLTLAAWVLMTYVYPALSAVPYLYLGGPAGSGKTRMMDLLSRYVFRPLMTGNTSAATIFRTRHAFGGVLLLDEVERMKDTQSPDVREILSILHVGYRRGGRAHRLEPRGDGYRKTAFDCYGPVIMGSIRSLPAALATRCITVRMLRALDGDEQGKRSLDDDLDEEVKVRDALHCWALEHGYRAVHTDLPEFALANRAAELWGPLIRIVAHSGDSEALMVMQQHADCMVAAVAQDASSDTDTALLSALWQLRSEGRTPRAGDVLKLALSIDSEAFGDHWTVRRVSPVLAKFGFKTIKSGSRIYQAEPAKIVDICRRYGIELVRSAGS